jgi:hypothetical protein
MVIQSPPRPVRAPVAEGSVPRPGYRHQFRHLFRHRNLAIALAGAAGLATISLAGSSWALPTHPGSCGTDQLIVTALSGAPVGGERFAQLQFTARNGQSCVLSGPQQISLADAPAVTVVPEPAGTPGEVTVSPRHPAHETLRWSMQPRRFGQTQPTAVLVRTTNGGGVTRRLAWRFGPVDTDTLYVGPVRPGPATPRPVATSDNADR